MRFYGYLTNLVLIMMTALSGCVTPVTVDSTDINGGIETLAGTEAGSGEDMTETLINSVFIIRVLPVDTSLGAEIFCTGVAVQPTLIITSASCFRAGVRYAEVLGGPKVNFTNNNPRLGVVTEVYTHRAYEPGFPTNNGADLAVVHVDQQLVVPIVEPYVDEVSQISSTLFRVGYMPNENLEFEKRVSFAMNLQVNEDVISFSTLNGSNDSICTVSGGPVLTTIGRKLKLVAISSRGDVSCTEGGNASLLKNSVTFINEANDKIYQLRDGQQAQVQGGLSCSQSFKCYEVSACLVYLTEEAREQVTDLYNCARDGSCNDPSCYQDTCPELFAACTGL